MRAEHEKAARAAMRAGQRLETLAEGLGSIENPGGSITGAYRQARRAMDVESVSPARATLNELKRGLGRDMKDALEAAAQIGAEQFDEELDVYDDLEDEFDEEEVEEEVEGLLEGAQAAWMAGFDLQMAAIVALIGFGQAEEEAILGDERHAGLLTPFPLIRDGDRWLATLMAGAYLARSERATRRSRTTFWKQAIAAIDQRTTETCLKVHGQVQPLRSPFRLTGEPRYADRMQGPPFHWRCRTATALVRPEDAEDALTLEMQAAARRELAAQAAAGKAVIQPAHARSGRT